MIRVDRNRKDQPLFDDPDTLPAQGKLDQFPIENEENRAMTPDHDISLESPLLLDPNNKDDDPENHLTYNIQGQIRPLNENDLFAKETIRICHLIRRRLRDARALIIAKTSRVMNNIAIAKRENNQLAETLLLDVLEDLTAPNSVYAGTARSVRENPDGFITQPIG